MIPRTMRVHADRDSVCAGDDTDPHGAQFNVDAGCTVQELLAAAWKACPLASISGGKASWLIDAGGKGGSCIGVAAQQWQHPKLLIAADTPASALFRDGGGASLYFRYWCQADPDAIFAALAGGAALPARTS